MKALQWRNPIPIDFSLLGGTLSLKYPHTHTTRLVSAGLQKIMHSGHVHVFQGLVIASLEPKAWPTRSRNVCDSSR